MIDLMALWEETIECIRIVEGIRGAVPMRMELVIRFDYGSIVPWVHRVQGALHAIAGPDSVVLRTPVEVRGEDMRTVAEFTVRAKDRVPFVLAYVPFSNDVTASNRLPAEGDAEPALSRS